MAISKAAIHKQLSNDSEFRKRYQFAREFAADMFYGEIIAIVDASPSRGFMRPSLALMKNWWPKNKSKASKRRQALIRAIQLLERYHANSAH